MAKQKKKKKTGLVLAMLACLVLVAAIIGGCIIYMNLDKDSGTQADEQRPVAEDIGEQVKSFEEAQSGEQWTDGFEAG